MQQLSHIALTRRVVPCFCALHSLSKCPRLRGSGPPRPKGGCLDLVMTATKRARGRSQGRRFSTQVVTDDRSTPTVAAPSR